MKERVDMDGNGKHLYTNPQLGQVTEQYSWRIHRKRRRSGIWCQTWMSPLVIHALLVGIEAMGTPCRHSGQVELRLGASLGSRVPSIVKVIRLVLAKRFAGSGTIGYQDHCRCRGPGLRYDSTDRELQQRLRWTPNDLWAFL